MTTDRHCRKHSISLKVVLMVLHGRASRYRNFHMYKPYKPLSRVRDKLSSLNLQKPFWLVSNVLHMIANSHGDPRQMLTSHQALISGAFVQIVRQKVVGSGVLTSVILQTADNNLAVLNSAFLLSPTLLPLVSQGSKQLFCHYESRILCFYRAWL